VRSADRRPARDPGLSLTAPERNSGAPGRPIT
jgi:hypothetical protein